MWSSLTLELPIRLSIYIHYIYGLLLPPNSKWAPHRGPDKTLRILSIATALKSVSQYSLTPM